MKETGKAGDIGRQKVDVTTVSDLIRSAEKFLASGKFTLAREQLTSAQFMDPQNTYIPAILDRIKNLEDDTTLGTQGLTDLGTELSQPSKRYLSVTVGSQFESGVRRAEDESVEESRKTQAQIRRLTNAAENFLESGSSKNAFESLMKAYLLDPMSPFVIACEKTVLPAWEKARARSSQREQESQKRARP